MKEHPVINLEDPVVKTVGQVDRRRPSDVQSQGRKLFASLGYRVCEPGVFRFRTQDEADQWMMEQAAKRSLASTGSPSQD